MEIKITTMICPVTLILLRLSSFLGQSKEIKPGGFFPVPSPLQTLPLSPLLLCVTTFVQCLPPRGSERIQTHVLLQLQ